MSSPASSIHGIAKKLMAELTKRSDRKRFFGTLTYLLQKQFHFDRLCINLYDPRGEMLTYFTAAEGTIVSTLSPVRPAEVNTTVAGHVIVSRKPVIITDFAQYFPDSTVHPIAEAGLKATMAFPLMLDNEIIATLHCSFAETPRNIYEIASVFAELSPIVATCLGAILSLEHLRYDGTQAMLQPCYSPAFDDAVICHSPAMREVMRKIDAVAPLDIPVLLLGETGTGKSLIAHEIHRRCPRKEARFVKVNCPSLPPTLFESELFGHARGAFTGAEHKRMGRFELAHGGSLFLDEIGELSPEMQSKLLQVLEDASFERVGESVPLAVDVRIISATNISVYEAIHAGKLRADLYYRLSGCVIELPPLRERKEDIPLLVSMLTRQLAAQQKISIPTFSAEQIRPLKQYHWPGNVRELRNVLLKAIVHSRMHKDITPGAMAAIVEQSALDSTRQASGARPPQAGDAARLATLEEIEREHILHVLTHTRGVISGPMGAARLLGLPRSTLQHRMQKLGIAAKQEAQ